MVHFCSRRLHWGITLLILAGGCLSPGTPSQVKNEPIREPGEVTLYDRLGGGSAIYAITDDFIDRAIADPLLNFQRVGHPHTWTPTPGSVAKLKLYWAQFLDMLVDGPAVYEGRNILEVHRGMDISEGEWFAMLENFKKTLNHFDIPADLQKELIARMAGTHDAIVNK